MLYKVLVVKNRLNQKFSFSKYLTEWFKKYTPLEITIEELATDFDVTTQAVSNGTYSGVICGADIVDKLRTVIPENKYHCVIFTYGNSLNGIRTNVANGAGGTGFLYKGTDLIQLCKVDDNGKTANHELFHTFFARLRRAGISLNDNMDTYIGNSDLSIDDFINTNRETALQTLKPYWDKISLLDIPTVQTNIPVPVMSSIAILARKTTNSKETLGDMIAIKNGGLFLCKTLERGIDLRIPNGFYQVEWTYSPKFKRDMYLVKVPNIEGIRIHIGNYYYQSEGCIMLGKSYADINNDGQLDVITSSVTTSEFENFFGKKSFSLLVI